MITIMIMTITMIIMMMIIIIVTINIIFTIIINLITINTIIIMITGGPDPPAGRPSSGRAGPPTQSRPRPGGEPRGIYVCVYIYI